MSHFLLKNTYYLHCSVFYLPYLALEAYNTTADWSQLRWNGIPISWASDPNGADSISWKVCGSWASEAEASGRATDAAWEGKDYASQTEWDGGQD